MAQWRNRIKSGDSVKTAYSLEKCRKNSYYLGRLVKLGNMQILEEERE